MNKEWGGQRGRGLFGSTVPLQAPTGKEGNHGTKKWRIMATERQTRYLERSGPEATGVNANLCDQKKCIPR